MNVKLISITPECEKVIEEAGRTCYNSKRNDPTIIQNWIRSGHHSVIEHASATFRIESISRACSHQLVRHRLASFSQRSQRYVEQDTAEFVIPESIKQNEKALNVYEYMVSEMIEAYETLRDYGIKKEDARFLLPNAITTEIVMTMNFRSFRNFFELRCDKYAQWEIREMALKILVVLYEHAPNVFGDLYEKFIVGENNV